MFVLGLDSGQSSSTSSLKAKECPQELCNLLPVLLRVWRTHLSHSAFECVCSVLAITRVQWVHAVQGRSDDEWKEEGGGRLGGLFWGRGRRIVEPAIKILLSQPPPMAQWGENKKPTGDKWPTFLSMSFLYNLDINYTNWYCTVINIHLLRSLYAGGCVFVYRFCELHHLMHGEKRTARQRRRISSSELTFKLTFLTFTA